MNYIEKLKSFEQVVHAMKLDAPLSSWNSLYVDYHPPIVESPICQTSGIVADVCGRGCKTSGVSSPDSSLRGS